MSLQVNSNSAPASELQPIAATTETTTEGTQPEMGASAEAASPLSDPERMAAKLEAARAECERLASMKFEADAAADKRLRKVQSEYGGRIMQLEQDLVAERQTNGDLSKKIEALEISLDEQTKGMRRIKQQLSEPAAAMEKANTEIQDLQQRYQALESDALAVNQERELLQGMLESSQRAQQNAESQIAELTARLEQTSRDLADKEHTSGKLSQQKAEELNAQVEKLQIAVEQAELRARESDAQSKNWERNAADLKKAIDELNQTRVDEQNANAQSAQRLKELELQLKAASDDLAASRAVAEKQNLAHQRLESENRSLTEANANAKADLDKERDTHNISQQEAKKLNAQLEKLQQAVEQAEARARESAAQSKDWERKAADQNKTVDELTRSRTAEQSAGAQSAKRIKELEQQLKGANDNLAASRADLEKQSSARQRLEAENRQLADTSAKTKADANNTLRQEAEKLAAQLKKLQHGVEEAEARARESAAQSKDWEKKAADLKKTVDELNQARLSEQSASAQSAQRLKDLEQQLKRADDDFAATNAKAKADLDKERTANNTLRQETEKLAVELKKLQLGTEAAEHRVRESAAQSAERIKQLEQQLKGANDNLAAGKTDLEKQSAARQRLESENRSLTEANTKTKADLDKERATNNTLRQETEKLTAQLQKLQHAGEHAETRARETVAQLKDWEKKAADLQKAINELNQIRASEQSASAQSLQRLKELELQLKGTNETLAASRAEAEKQDSARQRLEAENRKLAEANAKTKADLDEECDAHKLSRQAAQELSAELKKSQRAVEQAEARIRISTDQYCDLEEKAAELKKYNSRLEKELTERRRLNESLNKSLTEAQQQLELGKSERKKMDDELVRLREIEKHLQHEEYMMVDSLRRGLRQPIEDLRQSACGLLEGQLPDKQKRLAETVLRHALFLQVFLNASGKNAGEKFPS